MFCASDRPACHGGDVYGHEQCAVPGSRRNPQDERVAGKNLIGNAR